MRNRSKNMYIIGIRIIVRSLEFRVMVCIFALLNE